MATVDQFNDQFAAYVALWSRKGNRTVADALEKKGRDLGIKLYQGFRAHKWGGDGKAPKGLARAELDARAAAGQGIRVRASLLREYRTLRANLLSSIRNFIGPRRKGQDRLDIKAKVNLWRQVVGHELGIRQSGIGVLAASFLWVRRRSSQARGTYYVRNRVGLPIGAVQSEEGLFRIIGDVAGLSEVDARYGIVSAALDQGIGDMQQYISERLATEIKQELNFT